MTSVTINGNTYSDDGTAARDMTNGGHRTWLLPMIGDCGTVGAAADVDATAAAASASSAQTYAAALQGTSTTSIAVTTGSKTITTQSGKQFAAGQRVLVVRTSAPTTYLYGSVTSYSSTSLVVDVSDVAGSGTYTDWSIYLSGIKGAAGPSGATAPRLEKTGTYTIGASDKGSIVVATSGTFTFSFSAAATLAAGWYCWVCNEGTGLVTMDPNSSETIDGVTSFVMYPKERRLVYLNAGATALHTIIEAPFDHTWTASGSIVVPPGYRMFGGFLIGGGSGGYCGGRAASSPATGGSGGGGAGAAVFGCDVTAGETLTITVGAGGSGAAGLTANGSPAEGSDGGNTEILSGADSIYRAAGGGTTGTGASGGQSYAGVGMRARRQPFPAANSTTQNDGYYGGLGATGGAVAGAAGYSCYNNATYIGFGGAGGGAGGGVTTGTAYAGGAGGLLSNSSTGGGGAAGTAGGGAGGTATNGAGGGGGSNTTGTGGAGGNGSTYGHGGGGGGAVVGAYTSGAGGNGAAGMARLWGIL